MTTRIPIPAPAAARDLPRLVDLLDEAHPLGAPPTVMVVRDGPGASSPPEIDDLIGWRAPADVDAIAVVASGTARALSDHDAAAGAPGAVPARGASPTPTALAAPGPLLAPGARVQVVVVVCRDGVITGRVRDERGRRDEPPSGGRTVDILLRCFGLPTPPPPPDARELLASLWCTELLIDPAHRLSWRDALALHPLGTAHLADDPTATPAELEERITGDLTRDWAAVRRAAATSVVALVCCPPEMADWMDDGMWARWLRSDLVAARALLPAVRRRLRAPGPERIAALVG